MALSEREQRLLEEMERNLYQNEADIVTTLGERRAPNYTAIAVGAIVGLAGLITMVVGVYIDITLVGIAGFIVAFAGVMVAVAVPGKPTMKTASSGSSKPQASSGFMDRLNERWERRQGDVEP